VRLAASSSASVVAPAATLANEFTWKAICWSIGRISQPLVRKMLSATPTTTTTRTRHVYQMVRRTRSPNLLIAEPVSPSPDRLHE
jgi:hypothetical protein